MIIERKRITTLHRKAMRLAHEAETASGDRARRLARQAFEAERAAAELLYDALEEEPSRSILFRSAAILGLECNECREAERLAAAGLSGRPFDDVAAELREVLDRASFERHLALRGLELADDEFQLTVVGRGVGPGLATEQAFFPRYRAARSMFFRTAERLEGLPFSEKPRRETLERFEFFLAPPRAASFAVTVRVGRNLQLPGVEAGARQVIGEIVDCVQLFQDGEDEELRKRLPESYRLNFEALARQMAPDGFEVEMVGLTTFRAGVERRVALTRKRDVPPTIGVPDLEQITGESTRPSTIRGRLLFASSMAKTKRTRTIKIETAEGERFAILVPAEMMHDVVRPFYEAEVIVKVERTARGALRLLDVTGA